MKDLLDGLIARVEQATGPDRELDDAIFAALGFRRGKHTYGKGEVRWKMEVWKDDSGVFSGRTDPTASIDAALGLMERVLPNSKWGKDPEEDQPTIEVWFEPTPREPFREWDLSTATAATAPLAIILATLRALRSACFG